MYAILRTKRLSGISSACAHNLRTKYAKNVDKTKSHLNEIIIDNLDLSTRANMGSDTGTYDDRLLDYYKNKNAKVKQNSVMAMEFVLTASPEFFEKATPEKLNRWKKSQLNFMKKEFGDQVQFAVLHLDEKTPHLHFFVSVEETKMQKYKNRYGSGEKLVCSLNADRYNPIFLQKLQDRYAEYNKKYGLERGMRNSKAVHTELKEFQAQVKEFLDKKDYTSVIDNLLEKVPVFMGACKIETVKKVLTPVLNTLMKQSKAARITLKELPEKVQFINSLIEENEELNKELKEKKNYYIEAINEKIADKNKILELEEEVKRLEALVPKVAPAVGNNATVEKLTPNKKSVRTI